MRDYIAMLVAAMVAIGWTVGVLLVVLPIVGRVVPRWWALREFAGGRPRRVALGAGLILLLATTAVFLLVDTVRL